MASTRPKTHDDDDRAAYKVLITGSLYAETLENAATTTKSQEAKKEYSEQAAAVRRSLLDFYERER